MGTDLREQQPQYLKNKRSIFCENLTIPHSINCTSPDLKPLKTLILRLKIKIEFYSRGLANFFVGGGFNLENKRLHFLCSVINLTAI